MDANRHSVCTMTEPCCDRHIVDIWSAVSEGDSAKLQELINAAIQRNDETLKQSIGDKLVLLLLAIMSKNFEVVKLVTEYFEADPGEANVNGVTPVLFACLNQCPFEIIIYLMERSVQKDGISPLELAVRVDDVALTKALIAYASNRQEPFVTECTASLGTVTTQTGNLEILQCLLDAPNNAGYAFVTTKTNDCTGLDKFARKAAYDVEKKIAVFKMLFKVLHPEAYTTYPERYNVNEILNVALLSNESTSLIPYFIETERTWEKRPSILSLYERLLPKYTLLALAVLCECGPVTGDRDELDMVLDKRYIDFSWYQQLQEMFENAIAAGSEDEASSSEAKQLLEDLSTFSQSITLHFLRIFLRECVIESFTSTKIPCSALNRLSFQQTVCDMINLCNDSADCITEFLFCFEHPRTAIAIFVLLQYCTILPMRPNELDLELAENEENKMLNWIMHLFGPWKAIQQHVGKPKLELFTLQRFARDVVRESVWQGVKGMEEAEFLFLDRLQGLGIPKELKDYLRYCDYGTTQYFLKHFGPLIPVMENEADNYKSFSHLFEL